MPQLTQKWGFFFGLFSAVFGELGGADKNLRFFLISPQNLAPFGCEFQLFPWIIRNFKRSFPSKLSKFWVKLIFWGFLSWNCQFSPPKINFFCPFLAFFWAFPTCGSCRDSLNADFMEYWGKFGDIRDNFEFSGCFNAQKLRNDHFLTQIPSVLTQTHRSASHSRFFSWKFVGIEALTPIN